MIPDRDSPLYPWHRRPADHTPAGFFVHGPQPAMSPLVRLMGVTTDDVRVPSPDQVRARARMTRARKLARMRELEELVAAIAARKVA